MSKENKFAFPDTMIFLHFQFFTEIDWNKVLQTKSTTLVIPPIIPKELDKHKYNHPSEKIRERASKVTKKIVELIKSKSNFRNNVNIQFEAVHPQSEFEKYSLSKDSQDDHLIASLLRFQEDTGNKAVLITDDSGLKLKAPLFDIEVVELPEMYRIKPEKNTDKKEIERLRNELDVLKTKIPRLRLISLNNEEHISCFALPSEKFSNESLDSQLDEVKNKYHQIVETNKPKRIISIILEEGVSSKYLQPEKVEFKLHSGEIRQSLKEDVDNYNKKLKEFYVDYENYLREKYRINELRSQTVYFQVKLDNREGTIPAIGVNVILNFPTDFRVTTNKAIFSYPEEVEPPVFVDTSNIFNRNLLTPYDLSYLRTPLLPRMPTPDWKKVTIEKNNFIYTATFKTIKLSHGYSFVCPEVIYVIFPKGTEVKPFQIDYKITADNIPEAIKGKLRVKISKNTANPNYSNL